MYDNLKNSTFLIGKTLEELEELAILLNHKKFRGKQLFNWLYVRQVDNYENMSNLPVDFRNKLKNLSMHPLKLVQQKITDSKQTGKFLFSLNNGNLVESVLMHEGSRTTVCLSTQVGCAVDCDFCATAKMGFIQNLTSGEIIDQFLHLQKMSDNKITNVVFMGMGEPFLNYKNTLEAAHLLHDSRGINMGAWRITISTAGIVRKINQYAKDKEPFKLAVSLNGSNNNQRLKIMPITNACTLDELIEVSKAYTLKTRKRITFEYVMLKNINDSMQDAKNLISLIKSIKCKLNLIPYNEIDGPYRRPDDQTIMIFLKVFKNAPFPVTVRWSKGQDIDAGCGQLITKENKYNEKN